MSAYLGMASSKTISQAIDREAANSVYAELSHFVSRRNPRATERQFDKALSLDGYLESNALEKTNELITGFLKDTGRMLAAEFLKAKDAKLERSFLVLYCSRTRKEIRYGAGQMTIILALGGLSTENGLPKFGNNTASQELQSGDAVLVGSDTSHNLEENNGGGFALISDWSTAP